MHTYTQDKIIIGQKFLDRLTDEDGVNWYPLKTFISRILCKDDKVSSFRDSKMKKYLRVIEYNPNRPGARHNIKMWCINEQGIKYMLKRTTVIKKSSTKNYQLRAQGLAEACLYFDVKPVEPLQPEYLNEKPDIRDYDVWSILCIENDYKIKVNTKWKLCKECNRYFPDSVRYFKSTNGHTKKTCLQCSNQDFVCLNKRIQYIYENGGYDILYSLFIKDDKTAIEKFKLFLRKGESEK